MRTRESRKSRRIRKGLQGTSSVDAADERKDDRWFICGFLGACVLMLAGFGMIASMGGKPQPGVKIVTIAFWLCMASLNAGTFYSGEFTSRRGRVRIRRDESPGEFYLVAITSTVGSMAFATLMVGLAFFG